MKIRLIADGSTKWQRAIKRWGVAFLIGEDVLFDTFGDARVFAVNLRKHKIDVSKLRHVVISHDDWDHIAGLWDVLGARKGLRVYVGPHFKPELKDRIRSFGATLVEAQGPVMIRDGVYTAGELAGQSARGVLYEQAVVIVSAEKLSLITGCAHPGLSNILRSARGHFHRDIDLVMGGFHMKDMELARIRDIVESLPALGVRRVVPLHCTGALATKEFRRFFIRNFLRMCEGDSIEV